MEKTIALLHKGLEEKVFPSGIFVVGNKEGELFRYCVGNCTEETVYDLASVSKVISTTMIALQFIQEGKLSLFDRISYYLDDVPADKAEISIMHLMTHSGGFKPFHALPQMCETPDDIISVILNSPLQYEIGTEVVYSCTGYITLGKILERIGGKPLDRLFDEYVALPLGLTDIGYNLKGYDIAKTSDDYELGLVHDPNARFMGGVSGNAGVFSKIDSVSRFARMLANKGCLEDNVYLNSRMFEAAIRNYSKDGLEARGLGFSLKRDHTSPAGDLFSMGTFGHTGFTGTDFWIDKETGIYTVFLTNRVALGDDNIKIIAFRRVLHNCMMSELMKKGLL